MLGSAASLSPSAATGGPDEPNRHYRPLNGRSLHTIARSKAHHGHGRFINPVGIPRDGRFGQLLRWKLLDKNRFGDFLDEQPVIPLQVDWRPVQTQRGLSITFLKHACVLIRDLDRYFLVDPVFEGIFWFIKDFTPLAFDLREMPAPDHVLITHGHYDHLDERSLSRLKPDTHVISPLGYDTIFSGLGMHNRTALDWFDTFQTEGREIVFLPCNHWTMRSPLVGPNRSLWGSYLIRTAAGPTIFVSGDTAYFDGFGELGRRFDIDLAIFNLGAYEPRWFMAPSHINPRETVQAFRELNANRLMVVHWGTFRLGDEPVHFPPGDIRKELQRQGLLDRWVDIRHGQTYQVL
jgi:L-ascorbate metabolism protein UlaG (beta-lactamase superfamily)